MVWCRFGGYGHPSFHLVYHHAHHTPRPPKMGGRYLPPIFVSTRNLPRARQEQRNKSHLRSDASVAFATSVMVFPFPVCHVLARDKSAAAPPAGAREHRPPAAAADGARPHRPRRRAPECMQLVACAVVAWLLSTQTCRPSPLPAPALTHPRTTATSSASSAGRRARHRRSRT